MKKVTRKEPEKVPMKKQEKKEKLQVQKVSMKEQEKKNKLQVQKVSMKEQEKEKKLQVQKVPMKEAENKPKCFWPGGMEILYNGDPTLDDPESMEIMKKCAQLVIDFFNQTHINKYSFVKMVHATAVRCGTSMLHMVFKVKPEPPEEGKKPITVRAEVSLRNDYVEYLEFPEDQGNLPMRIFPLGSVIYDGEDPTSCDAHTIKMIQGCADLALQVYNKMQAHVYSMGDLGRATRHLSTTGSMVDLVFTAKPCDDVPITLEARVSVTHNYVEFVELVRPRLP
ncbi:hypothetical protein MIMGU_mgv1a011490mg [Erythranthe guttata]|uniref:Cystatin domain-containing protein n=1 Tax=Erythranthe guttata TaxID=4155 RepID=A0A022QBL1_ERYGU|nr:PREDICTED: uncharacterized protein LOC105971686 [Erythranthe guttata]XP_012852008.1 PREDICTED: uncharacterized protein LOC105971686 [Erythranthe guttata]EYU24988.1 hypothetical protein MIMGU_mgv1a011490mg [Erythranthe guttata]EYU24989.1 hypothetical protein MIMGU_mgv1a011490mg [Erythranthe guttata]|eukprot:XP_012852007.1 PREDICTED: uncharacterized protein LOC105971686 [Erythranthe guttata]